MSVVSLSVLVLLGLITLISGLIKLNFTHDQFPPLDSPIARTLLAAARRIDENIVGLLEDYSNTNNGNQKQDSEARSNEKETFTKAIKDIIEYVQTDGHPGHPPSGGISWIAFFILFGLLSPILIPMLLSPVILLIAYLIFIPSVLYSSEAGGE